MNLDNPRQISRDLMKQSLSEVVWNRNSQLVTEFKKELAEHPINFHPMIEKLNQGEFNHKEMQKIHLEYRHAIVQIFTDALLMAQVQTKQLEPRFTSGVKMYPRFLLTLNTLDEFGFSPGFDNNNYYKGNPFLAHYPLFERVLNDYDISQEARESYIPSDISNDLRNFLENSYVDYSLIVALLAVAEQEVVLFSQPLRKNTKSIGIDTSQGYYYCHGTSEDVDTDANDDDHEHDLWLSLIHAITEPEFENIKTQCLEYCDLWVKFWDHQNQ